MTWPLHYNTLVVLLGTSLLGASAGLVGSFAVLRRQALIGDALAHAALPGLCAAFLLAGGRSMPAMLAGALATGLLGIVLISGLRRWTRIKEDAAIGIVLSVLFGAGIVLSSWIQNHTTTGSKAGLDSYILGKTAGMLREDVYWLAGLGAGCVLVMTVLYKEFKLVAFDAGFAAVQGWPAVALDLLLMALVAVTVVLGLPAAGVVLMAALLILPAAAARFWTQRLGHMVLLSGLFGAAIGSIGSLLSAGYSGMPAGPIIVLVGSVLFFFSVLFAPKRGAVARWLNHVNFRRTIAEQRLLLAMYELVEPQLPKGREITIHALQTRRAWRASQLEGLLRLASRKGWIERLGTDRVQLTQTGFREAIEVTRTARLWRQLLAEQSEAAGSLADLDALSIYERLPPGMLESLEVSLRAQGNWPLLEQEATS